MSRFLEALHSGRVLLMDGAMGTELLRAGIREGECYELWNLTNPDRVRAIHQSYVNAGAEVLLTNTFQTNPYALERHGLQHRLNKINQAAICVARSVAGPDRFVLGDIGPVEKWDLNQTRELLWSLRGADAFLFETYSELILVHKMLKVHALKSEEDRRPILLSFTYFQTPEGELLTSTGETPEACAGLGGQWGVVAIGVNCGREIGIDEIIEIVRRYRRVTDVPLFARPNAGTPTRAGDRWIYPHTPEKMASRLPELLEAGVAMVGGCCGTTPEHIAAFRPFIDEWNAQLLKG
jgi:5-methyltetrahydrofolate--homocysteine methyltransferase